MIRIVSTEATANMLRNAGELAISIDVAICLLWCGFVGTSQQPWVN